MFSHFTSFSFPKALIEASPLPQQADQEFAGRLLSLAAISLNLPAAWALGFHGAAMSPSAKLMLALVLPMLALWSTFLWRADRLRRLRDSGLLRDLAFSGHSPLAAVIRAIEPRRGATLEPVVFLPAIALFYSATGWWLASSLLLVVPLLLFALEARDGLGSQIPITYDIIGGCIMAAERPSSFHPFKLGFIVPTSWTGRVCNHLSVASIFPILAIAPTPAWIVGGILLGIYMGRFNAAYTLNETAESLDARLIRWSDGVPWIETLDEPRILRDGTSVL